jgi:hypothetical protein
LFCAIWPQILAPTFSEDGDVPGLKRPSRLTKNERQ